MTKENLNCKKTIAMNRKVRAPKGEVFELGLEEFVNVTQTDEVASLITKIRSTEDKDERRRLKGQLPFRCPHYFRFRDDHRAQDAILPEEFTFQTCVDIDDETMVAQARTRAFILNNKEGEWQGMLLHMEYSASKKLHIDIRIPVGMTIEEAQRAYTKALGVDFDSDCCSPERMIYIVDSASQLYTSPEWQARLSDEEIALRRKAYAERGLDIDGREGKISLTSEQEPKIRPMSEHELKIEPMSNEGKNPPVAAEGKISPSNFPTEYAGIPYSYIVEELADQLGGVPVHGSRNAFIFSMACHLRYVCNDDAQWIRSVLPNYGEAQDRVDATIASACKRNQSATMNQKMKTAITLARKRKAMENGTDEQSLMHQPQMPERLPASVRLITSKAPRGYWPCIINTTFSALATYMGGVKAEFWNGRQEECTLLNGLVAPMSAGKSSIKDPINHIVAPIERRDMEARQREREWAEATNCKGANKEKPERPADICVQIVDSDMTNAALTQRLDDAERAGNKALFCMMDEMEQLKKMAGGSMAEVTEIIRRDFDTDKYGQERVGTQSVKARTTLRMNMVFSTTPNTAKMYLGKNIDNGTLSRLSLSTIVKEDVERRPKFKAYDETYDKKLAVYQARLENVKGTIVCPQAKRLAETLLDRAEERALMMGNESYEQLSYRAVEIAFRKSIILYVMNGQKWSKEIEELVTYLFDYDMWVKMCLFGEEITNKLAKDNRVMKPGVPCLLELLNDSFTRQEFEILYKAQNATICNISKAASNLLSQWKKRGWIEENVEQKIYVKTEAYYQKHAA